MNTTKLVAATLAAASVLGGIGFAYAQTASPAASSPTTDMQQPMPATTPPAPIETTPPSSGTNPATMNAPAAGTVDGTTSTPARRTMPNAGAATPSDGSTMPTERAARTDRN